MRCRTYVLRSASLRGEGGSGIATAWTNEDFGRAWNHIRNRMYASNTMCQNPYQSPRRCSERAKTLFVLVVVEVRAQSLRLWLGSHTSPRHPYHYPRFDCIPDAVILCPGFRLVRPAFICGGSSSSSESLCAATPPSQGSLWMDASKTAHH